ncbi:MAG TPA: hypothetical protein PKC09_02830 [Paracoccus sp. (in: a-proteobacteria)]|uniref:DUF6880 family protein n=1 Tax=uncultured Paracoccus sp. TaxID=189685 RepID=UPI00262B8CFF|nr:DUF6880 family protein [uncultured Paracoccus sp.]HMQ40185.1 hypothetical protein [Paracoccus sp. (in: a-proteobacteria)]HMR37343.1 hypothetical protein [Paracoccus sp. (in: a-proteobacteria)]
MARKPALTNDKLKDLGADKLAQLVLDEAERNAGFRRQVKAALVGKNGPEAIAKLIDRRLSGLARAKSFIEWDKARAFAEDLRSLINTITSELGPAAPALATDRLLRFIATHEQVFERVDDSSGRVQDVYHQAIQATGDLARSLTAPEADLLPEKIMTALGESTHGYLADVTEAVAAHLPPDSLARWDNDLKDAIAERQARDAARKSDDWFYSVTSQWAAMRQTLASARGDLDLLIALELKKKPHMQDTLGIAAQLLESRRSAEALEWVRKPGRRTFGEADDGLSPERVSLEARILDATGDSSTAQALRWRCFEARLPADILREHLKQLPDFEDIEAEERAHAFALEKAEPELALQFFLDWPRLDLAAKLITTHPHRWDGGDWHILPKVAGLLEHEHPLASTILYRALLDDILDRARSKAYGHGAKYLGKLGLLAGEADPIRPSGMVDHATYLARLKTAHPRKSGFWARVGDGEPKAPQASGARRPVWIRDGE